MRSSVTAVHRLVAALDPWDDLEAQHQTDTLCWLEDTDDVFRRSKPATPDPHLVSYVVMVDPDDRSSLLVDHISPDPPWIFVPDRVDLGGGGKGSRPGSGRESAAGLPASPRSW